MSCWHCQAPDPDPYCPGCRSTCTRREPCSCCLHRGYPAAHRLPAEVLAAYEHRIPGAADAAAADPSARHTRALLVFLLAAADAAMTDEDVPARTRHRVLNTLAYGAVTPPGMIERDRAEREHATMSPLLVPVQSDAVRDALRAEAGLPPLSWPERADAAS